MLYVILTLCQKNQFSNSSSTYFILFSFFFVAQIGQCRLQIKTVTFSKAKFHNKEQKLYTCIDNTAKDTEIHVLSNYGNKFDVYTEIDITDERTNASSYVLVLANYQRVTWRIQMKSAAKLKKIFLVSEPRHSAQKQVMVNFDPFYFHKEEVIWLCNCISWMSFKCISRCPVFLPVCLLSISINFHFQFLSVRDREIIVCMH